MRDAVILFHVSAHQLKFSRTRRHFLRRVFLPPSHRYTSQLLRGARLRALSLYRRLDSRLLSLRFGR